MFKFIISGEEIKSRTINTGLLVLRLFAGLGMAFGHGIKKLPVSEGFIGSVGKLGFPTPGFFAWAAGLSEFAGGILLAIGLFTRPSALFLATTMGVAAFIRHADDPFSGKEKALLYFFVFILYLLIGSGRYGADSALRRKFPLI